jgi:hypothetical protein
VAFKEYAAPIALFVALFLWRADAARARPWILTMVATAAAFVLPFFLWNPAAFVRNVGGELIAHTNVWGRNVWHDALSLAGPQLDVLTPAIPLVMAAAALTVAVVLWRRPAGSLGTAFLQGCLLLATVLLLARWTTSVYYVFLAPMTVVGIVFAFAPELRRVPLPGP